MPRQQRSLRSLILIVAVAALNLAAYRAFYRRAGDDPSTVPLSLAAKDVVIGSLPLLDVALIGTLFYVLRRTPSSRRGREPLPCPRPAGVAFLSLHFLCLGCVLFMLMPGPIKDYLATATLVTDREWQAVTDQYPVDCTLFVMKCSILGILISGPPLLLSWLGSVLARHYAATVSQRRFAVMTCLVSFGFALTGLAIWLRPRPFAEEHDVELQLQIIDKDSCQPIGATAVRITDQLNPNAISPIAITDNAGWAKVTGRFPATGERIAFGTIGIFSTWGRWLEISASHLEMVRVPLAEVVGPHVELDRASVRKIEVSRDKPSGNSFQDIAGGYSSSIGEQAWHFEIEQDGRFVWTASGCIPPDDHECGYMTRDGQEIQVVPSPHPGHEFHGMMPLRLQAIRWGERLYLSATEDYEFQAFCRAGLNLKPPANAVYSVGGYVRDSDRGNPRTGLPALPPKVWVNFLLDLLGRRNDNGSAKPAVESLLLRQVR